MEFMKLVTYISNDSATFRIGGNINGTTTFLGHGGLTTVLVTVAHILQVPATIKLTINDYITFTNGAGGTRTFYQGVGHTYGHIYLVG